MAPDAVFRETREHLPATPEATAAVVQAVEPEIYAPFQAVARYRLTKCDEDDWPILAKALALRCPIWTEDTDFFSCGYTWRDPKLSVASR